MPSSSLVQVVMETRDKGIVGLRAVYARAGFPGQIVVFDDIEETEDRTPLRAAAAGLFYVDGGHGPNVI
jgi:hypothetical protein